jgi:hypothetical protein
LELNEPERRAGGGDDEVDIGPNSSQNGPNGPLLHPSAANTPHKSATHLQSHFGDYSGPNQRKNGQNQVQNGQNGQNRTTTHNNPFLISFP